jgi:hypothetical protein
MQRTGTATFFFVRQARKVKNAQNSGNAIRAAQPTHAEVHAGIGTQAVTFAR